MEKHIEREMGKLEGIRDNPEYDDGIRKDIRNRIAKLNDDLSEARKYQSTLGKTKRSD